MAIGLLVPLVDNGAPGSFTYDFAAPSVSHRRLPRRLDHVLHAGRGRRRTARRTGTRPPSVLYPAGHPGRGARPAWCAATPGSHGGGSQGAGPQGRRPLRIQPLPHPGPGAGRGRAPAASARSCARSSSTTSPCGGPIPSHSAHGGQCVRVAAPRLSHRTLHLPRLGTARPRRGRRRALRRLHDLVHRQLGVDPPRPRRASFRSPGLHPRRTRPLPGRRRGGNRPRRPSPEAPTLRSAQYPPSQPF